jgi:Fungal specific transcription factor domain
MLLDIPTSMPISEINLPLPSTEEEWSSSTEEQWLKIHNNPITPSPPSFQDSFKNLFTKPHKPNYQYSEFGGYIMISGIQSMIMNSYRLSISCAITINWKKFDEALDHWQLNWNIDPKSHSTGPSSPFGAMAFNASAIYRATSIRRIRDYSK